MPERTPETPAEVRRTFWLVLALVITSMLTLRSASETECVYVSVAASMHVRLVRDVE